MKFASLSLNIVSSDRFFCSCALPNHHTDKEIDSVWQKLTPLEQKEFEETVKTGRIGHLLAVRTPWWEVSLMQREGQREGERERSMYICLC